MRRMMMITSLMAAALMTLAVTSAPARALAIQHGLEVQGGMGHYEKYDEDWLPDSEWRWVPAGALGWFVESGPYSGFRVGTALAIRLAGDEIRNEMVFMGERYSGKFTNSFQQVVMPVRVEREVPGAPWLGIEAGAQAYFTLKATQNVRTSISAAARHAGPLAQIFEGPEDEEITSHVRRLGGAYTVGLNARTRVFSRDATFAATYEQGLTPLWRDGLDRYSRQVRGTFRLAW